MLSREDNARMCNVGPEQPMGRLVRRHWIPFLESGKLVAGADPIAVQLADEDFVAWRDEAGRPGLFDRACLHRGASLQLARAEGDGLRCVFHGWKFAVDGTVMDTPNVADPMLRTRLRGRAHPVREAGGILWVYLGPVAEEPEFPRWNWLNVPASRLLVVPHVQECSFVQTLEALVDSSHFGLLHKNALRRAKGSSLAFASKVASMEQNLAPRIEVQTTDFGFYYAAMRDIEDETGQARVETRITAFVAPFTQLNPNGDVAAMVIPVSSTRCMFWHIYWSDTEDINVEPLRSKHLKFVGLTPASLERNGLTPETIGLPGTPSPANNFLQDRKAMRENDDWSGLPGVIEEDFVMTVSSGAIRDRTKEMLVPADAAVAHLYRALLNAADAAEADPMPRIDWPSLRAFQIDMQPGEPWRTHLPGGAPARREETSPA